VNESIAHPREIFKPAIVHPAYSFVMVHNHPSGDPSPSDADLRLTRRINEASRILQINLLDHVIIGAPAPKRNSYCSFKEAGSSDDATGLFGGVPCLWDLPDIQRASPIKLHRESSPPHGEPSRRIKTDILCFPSF
jgi:RadC-like JAB domain